MIFTFFRQNSPWQFVISGLFSWFVRVVSGTKASAAGFTFCNGIFPRGWYPKGMLPNAWYLKGFLERVCIERLDCTLAVSSWGMYRYRNYCLSLNVLRMAMRGLFQGTTCALKRYVYILHRVVTEMDRDRLQMQRPDQRNVELKPLVICFSS